MRITEFQIRRYGPLRDRGIIKPSGYTLFFGDNEDGKTLTIDALVRMLFGKGAKRAFDGIERVEENPEGYVILKDAGGKEFKLPERGVFSGIAEVSPNECSNIFVIRDSDLSIADEHIFYGEITDRLTGLRTTHISSIVETLRRIGNITSTGLFRNTGDDRLKSRLEEASSLIRSLRRLRSDATTQNLAQIENQIVTEADLLKRLEMHIEKLEEARLREKYEKGREAITRIIEATRGLELLQVFNDHDEQTWRNNERDAERLAAELVEFNGRLESERLELAALTSDAEKCELEWRESKNRKKEVDETIRPMVKRYEERSAALPHCRMRRIFFGKAALFSAILLVFLTAVLIVTSSQVLSFMLLLFIALLTASGGMYYYFSKKIADISADFNRLVNITARYDLDGQDLPRMLEKIQVFEENHSRIFDKLQSVSRKKDILLRSTEELSKKIIPGVSGRIEKLKNEIEELRRKSGEETPADYSQKMRDKNRLEKIQEIQFTLLKSEFGGVTGELTDKIRHYEDEIGAYVAYKTGGEGLSFSEAESSRMKEEQGRLKNSLNDLKSQQRVFVQEMTDLERRANEILQTGEEYIYCKNLSDLDMAEKILTEFIARHETLREIVLSAIDIFGDIDIEERAKIQTLFGEKRAVSEFFRAITGGRYTEVTYDQAAGQVYVTETGGRKLPAHALSGGTYDQLYFAVRLALGEELLRGEKGFFVLDDPFIKSDRNRLRDQIKMLKSISKRGWQVLFFSAKTEVAEEMKGDIDAGIISMVDYRVGN